MGGGGGGKCNPSADGSGEEDGSGSGDDDGSGSGGGGADALAAALGDQTCDMNGMDEGLAQCFSGLDYLPFVAVFYRAVVPIVSRNMGPALLLRKEAN